MAIAGSPSSLQGPRHGITQVEAQEGAEHVQPQGLLSTQTRRHQDEVGRPQGPRALKFMVPQKEWVIRKNPMELNDLGVPLF